MQQQKNQDRLFLLFFSFNFCFRNNFVELQKRLKTAKDNNYKHRRKYYHYT